jgi:hypothetical protein
VFEILLENVNADLHVGASIHHIAYPVSDLTTSATFGNEKAVNFKANYNSGLSQLPSDDFRFPTLRIRTGAGI